MSSKGSKLYEILSQVTGMHGGAPTGADIDLSKQPTAEPRGIFGVLQRLNQMGASNRVNQEALDFRRNDEARKQAEAESLIKSREILGEQRQAQTERTRNLISVDNAKVELDKATLDLKKAMQPAELKLLEIRGEALIQNASAALQNAQTNLMRAENDSEKLYFQNEVKQRELELTAARNKWQQAVAEANVRINEQRANSYKDYVDKAATGGGDTTTISEVVDSEEGFDVTPKGEGEPMFIPKGSAAPFFKVMEKNKDIFGGKKGFFGFGSTPPPTIVPSTKESKKTTTTTKKKTPSVTVDKTLPEVAPPIEKLNKDGSKTKFKNGQVWHLDLATNKPVRDK